MGITSFAQREAAVGGNQVLKTEAGFWRGEKEEARHIENTDMSLR